MNLTSPQLSLKDNDFIMITPDSSNTSKDEMERLKEELKKWKERVGKAEETKADLLLSKSNADEEYVKAGEELVKLKNFQEKRHKDIIMSRDSCERELCALNQENAELKKEIEKLKEDLAECRSVLSQDGQIKKKVAEMKVKFTHMEDMTDDNPDMNTHCVFGVTTKIPFRLNQNQALITFEDEEVAQRLIKMGKHTVNLDNKIADVRVKPFTLDMGIRFELHVTISGKKINISEIPELSIPEDWMRDKLELNFYKSELGGGGEVENVSYDKPSRTAVITFLTPGAANSFVRCTKYPFFVNGRCCRLSVSPNTNVHLEKFQATGQAAKSARTVVITGVPDGLLHNDVMADILTIHFQMSKNNGGDVEEVMYPTRKKGVAFVTFEDQEVVESVLKKDEHRLEDKRLSRYYPLKVTRYCENVFSSVTSVLNMSIFKDQFVLEDLIQELRKKSTALSFGPLQSNGHISVQGSFPAMKLLRDFLLLKAKSLSEEDKKEESQSRQRPQRRLQQHRLTTETSNSVHDADGEKQVVVLDTDTYHYMKYLFPRIFVVNGDVVVSDITDGDITTVYIENAGSRSDAGQVLRVKEKIENQSIKLHEVLRKEKIYFEEHTRDERRRYKLACKSLKPYYPSVLVIPYDTHIDVIGNAQEIFDFTKNVSSKVQSLLQRR